MTQTRGTAFSRWVRGLLVAAVVLVAAGPLWAQGAAGKIEGVVRDPTGQPVGNAQVFVVGTGFTAITNENGYYFINNVPPGTYTVRAQFIGYQPAEVRSLRVFSEQTYTVNFDLQGAVALEAITIEGAENPIVPRDQVTSKSIIRGEDVAGLPTDDGRAILAIQPGVVESGADLGLVVRGGRPGEAVLFIDNVPVRSARTGANQLNVGTNALEEASVTTGALGAEFGDAQSGVISLVTRSGGPAYQGSLSYETDEAFGNDISVGFNRFEGSFSGPVPVINNLTFFVSGTLQGQNSDFRGEGADEPPLFVPAGIDTVVTRVFSADSQRVGIPNFAQYNGDCSAAGNFGFECQGRRFPYDWHTVGTANGKLQWTYGGGSRVSASALLDIDQNRFTPNEDMYNPQEYSGTRRTSGVYVVNWVQQVFRSAERELAFDLNLSYQTDNSITGVLDRAWELDHRDPTGGVALGRMQFLVDFDRFSNDGGAGSVRALNSNAQWDQLVDNVIRNQGTRSPFLNRTELRGSQPFRLNPWAVSTGFFTGGIDEGTTLEQERRAIGRANVDWQADRFNRFKFGGEYQWSRVNFFSGNTINNIFNNAYTEQPKRAALYGQDRLDLGDVVVELGLRWDWFDTGALFALVPGRINSDPDFDLDAPLESQTDVLFQASDHTAVSPRVRVSFPVTDRTNFRLSYAHQAQSPNFQAMLNGKNNDYSFTNSNNRFGGDVDFAKSILFEFGIRHAFSQDMVLDVAAFNKDKLSDLAYRILPFVDPRGDTLQSNVLTNADFGNVRGVDVSLIRRISDWFNGQVAYTFQDAKSTGSDPFSYLNTTSRQISFVTNERVPPPQAILPIDDNRRHNIAGSFAFNFPGDFQQGKWYGDVLENLGVFGLFRFASGLPFTRLRNQGNGQTAPRQAFGLEANAEERVNESNMPWVKEFDLRVTKGFRLGPVDWTVFGDFRNILGFTNVVQIFAETGEITNSDHRDEFISPELARLEQDAGSRLIEITKNGETLSAIDLGGDCGDWGGTGGVVDCVLLRRAEALWGDGDGIYDLNEQNAALNALYELNNGRYTKLGQPRHIRLGVELNF